MSSFCGENMNVLNCWGAGAKDKKGGGTKQAGGKAGVDDDGDDGPHALQVDLSVRLCLLTCDTPSTTTTAAAAAADLADSWTLNTWKIASTLLDVKCVLKVRRKSVRYISVCTICDNCLISVCDHGFVTLYKPLAIIIANGKIRPPVSPKPFDWFRQNLKLGTTFRRPPGMRCVNVGGLGEHPVCHCKFLSFLFVVSSARTQVKSHQWIDPHQNRHVSAVPTKDVTLGGLNDDQSRLGVQVPQKSKF